jgi:hypothetical protein
MLRDVGATKMPAVVRRLPRSARIGEGGAEDGPLDGVVRDRTWYGANGGETSGRLGVRGVLGKAHGLGWRAASGGTTAQMPRAGGADATRGRATSRRGARSGSTTFHCAPI